MAVSLHQLLKTMLEMGASELHLDWGYPPRVRIDGRLRPLDLPPLGAIEIQQLAGSILPSHMTSSMHRRLHLTHSLHLASLGFFAIHVFRGPRGYGVVVRHLLTTAPSLAECRLGDLERLKPSPGIYLIGGPRGSGRSTTALALVQHWRAAMPTRTRVLYLGHLWAPVESTSTGEFFCPATVLRSSERVIELALGGGFDIVVLDPFGQIKDAATVIARLSNAGSVVVVTVAGRSVLQVLRRVLDSADRRTRRYTTVQDIADGLTFVSAQQLVSAQRPTMPRCLAIEYALPSSAFRQSLRNGDFASLHQRLNVLSVTPPADKQSMELSLARLCAQGLVSRDEAERAAPNRDLFVRCLWWDPKRRLSASVSRWTTRTIRWISRKVLRRRFRPHHILSIGAGLTLVPEMPVERSAAERGRFLGVVRWAVIGIGGLMPKARHPFIGRCRDRLSIGVGLTLPRPDPAPAPTDSSIVAGDSWLGSIPEAFAAVPSRAGLEEGTAAVGSETSEPPEILFEQASPIVRRARELESGGAHADAARAYWQACIAASPQEEDRIHWLVRALQRCLARAGDTAILTEWLKEIATPLEETLSASVTRRLHLLAKVAPQDPQVLASLRVSEPCGITAFAALHRIAAEGFLKQGAYSEAERYCLAALVLTPHDPETLAFLDRCRSRTGEHG